MQLEAKDPREVEDFKTEYKHPITHIYIKGGYKTRFSYIDSPTGNCQLGSANNFCNLMPFLNKYKIRDLFIKMRKSHNGFKKILLLDLNAQYAESVIEWLPPGAIVGNMPYKSTNGSLMNVILIKLSLVRQLQLPK